MREHVENLAPEEACGLVAGVEGRSVEVFPVENALHSEVRYRMEPREQLKAMLTIEENGWEIAAIYHSHPFGPEGPSMTDIEEAAYTGVIHLIWNQQGGGWSCRGYSIEGGTAREIEIALLNNSNSFRE
jgi:[CysO sulfur-carrier protein]-S-L-cysteine hydrolase